MEREIDRFKAKADDGTVYTVVLIQQYIDASSMSNPNQWIEGMRRMELDDGTAVNYVD